jgi:ABC-type multidrug transport system ATPase subunit/ABC-type multidrug transport system permease subunit
MEEQTEHAIVCNNLSISAISTATRKPIHLLRHFTAKFVPGQVVGILGPSGCGKTSLLKCLHSCKPAESHQLFFHSKTLTSNLARRHFAYLPQEDVLPPFVTVFEYLLFCSKLYEPSLTYRMCVTGVEYLLQKLMLETCAHVLISQISGGQKRRVSVCSVFIRSGRLKDSNGRSFIHALLLDEPLTGLDSSSAAAMMTELSRTSRGIHLKPNQPKRIVLLSLHQPTKRLFQTLDYVIILGSQQRELFSGTRLEAENIFQPSIGSTVAEIALSVASTIKREDLHGGGGSSGGAGSKRKNNSIQTVSSSLSSSFVPYSDSLNDVENGSSVQSAASTTSTSTAVETELEYLEYHSIVERARKKIKSWKERNKSKRSTGVTATTKLPLTDLPSNVLTASFFRQFFILSQRAYFRLVRKPLLLRLHIIMTLVFSFIICLLWNDVGSKSNFEGLHNRMGCLFFMVCFFGFSSLSALTLFLDERSLFIRERNNYLYNTNIYILVAILFDIVPLRILPPILMGVIVYHPVGLRRDPIETFPRFVALLVLANTGFACASYFIGSITSTTSVATFSGGLFMLIFLAFGGVFLSLKSLPLTMAWMPYLTPSKFAYDGLIKNELVNVTFSIGTGTIIPFIGELKANVRGDQILDKMGFSISRYQPISIDIISLLVIPLLYIILTWFIVKWCHKDR